MLSAMPSDLAAKGKVGEMLLMQRFQSLGFASTLVASEYSPDDDLLVPALDWRIQVKTYHGPVWWADWCKTGKPDGLYHGVEKRQWDKYPAGLIICVIEVDGTVANRAHKPERPKIRWCIKGVIREWPGPFDSKIYWRVDEMGEWVGFPPLTQIEARQFQAAGWNPWALREVGT